MERAGSFRRCIAYLIDTLVTILVLIPFWVWYITGLLGPESGIYLLGYSLLIPLCWGAVQLTWFSLWWSVAGGTPGMLLLRLRLVDAADGSRASLARSILRYLALSLTALTLGLGFLPCLFREDHKALHDLVTHTYIIKY